MRMAFGMAALVTCIAAQPATAREEPVFSGEVPAPVAAFQGGNLFPIGTAYQPGAAIPAAGALPPVTFFPAIAALSAMTTLPIAGDFRLHATVAVTDQAPSVDADSRLRHRIASAMMEFYPVTGTGFHLSAGMRMFSRTNFMAEAEKFTGGLLFAPHGMGNSAVRNGFKRYTPAMTVGYTRMIQRDLSLGLEAGSLLGHAYSGIPGRIHNGASLGGSGAAMNPIMNLVVGARF